MGAHPPPRMRGRAGEPIIGGVWGLMGFAPLNHPTRCETDHIRNRATRGVAPAL